ncbi:MAG: hypothetical protein ACQCN5_10275 [Candidatus Bathyarchaeia archaeon]|jgi:hypothetical protein
MNYRTKTAILTLLILTCLTLPIAGLAGPITVTSTGPAYIEFSAQAQGQCFVEIGTTPSETPTEYYFGQGNTSLTGSANGTTNYDGTIANGTVHANGNLHIEFSDQAFDLTLQSNNETLAYFLSDNYPVDDRDNFSVGCDFSKEITPKETHLLATGNKTNSLGTEAFSGTILFYADVEETFGYSNHAIGAIIYDANNTVLASIIWLHEDTEVPYGLTLSAADVFQNSVDFYTIAPSLKVVTNASGSCVYSVFPEGFDEYSEMPQLQHGNGSLSFNAITISEATVAALAEEYYEFDNGVYGFGSIILNMQDNQSIRGNIYTNGSGTRAMFYNIEGRSLYMIGNAYQNNGNLLFTGTRQNATGTYNIQGNFEIYCLEVPSENSTETISIVEVIIMDENEYPIAVCIWSMGDYPGFSESNNIELIPADIFERSIDYCPSACTTKIISDNNTIIVDHTTVTGAKITINGANLPTGTAFNITTVNYGSTQPISVSDPPTEDATYFEVRILQTDGSRLNPVTTQVSLTDSSFNASCSISYWNGYTWLKAANQQYTAPNTITGEVLASVLSDTAIKVDYSATPLTATPSPSASPSESPAPTSSPSASTSPTSTTDPEDIIPEYSLFAILGLMALLTVFVAVVRIGVGKKASNFKNTKTQI